jgi:3-isopropylmalate dehydrogenase
MSYRILLLPGDGIGPEIVAEAEKLLLAVGEKFGLEFSFTRGLLGGCAIDATAA